MFVPLVLSALRPLQKPATSFEHASTHLAACSPVWIWWYSWSFPVLGWRTELIAVMSSGGRDDFLCGVLWREDALRGSLIWSTMRQVASRLCWRKDRCVGSSITGAEGGTLGSLAPATVGVTLGSQALVTVGDTTIRRGGEFFSVSECGTLGCGADRVGVYGGRLKRDARWMSCFRVSVSIGGSRVEWFLEISAAVRSLAADTMVSSLVDDGILKLCGNHCTV